MYCYFFTIKVEKILLIIFLLRIKIHSLDDVKKNICDIWYFKNLMQVYPAEKIINGNNIEPRYLLLNISLMQSGHKYTRVN